MTDVRFARRANDDLTDLLRFLADSYVRFGERPGDALGRATERVQSVRDEIARGLALKPERGTRRDGLLASLRSATFGRAIAYFRVDDAAGTVTVLAVFYGGQDHEAHMLDRLRG